MDSNPLERERGITILAKNTSVRWGEHEDQHRRHARARRLRRRGRAHPAHGGRRAAARRRVRRADAADAVRAAQGAGARAARRSSSSTRSTGRTPSRCASTTRCSSCSSSWRPTRRSSTRRSSTRRRAKATPMRELDDERRDLTPLFETIVETVPPPPSDAAAPFQMLVSTIDYSPYLGRLGDRPHRARHGARRRRRRAARPRGAERRRRRRTTARGMGASRSCTRSRGSSASRCRGARPARSSRWPGSRASRSARPSPTPSIPSALEGIAVEEPTISVDFIVNNSPFAGKEGKFVTVAPAPRAAVQGAGAQRRAAGRGHRLDGHVDRLGPRRAASRDSDGDDAARGLRVPGLAAARDHARRAPNGERLEPYEELVDRRARELLGVVIEKLGPRKGEMLEMRSSGSHGGAGPAWCGSCTGSRRAALFGYRKEFLTDTRGEGVLHHRFHGTGRGPVRRAPASAASWSA